MSKTKEEILFEEGNKELPDGIYPGMANDKIYNAMEVFAKERSIAFAEWMAENNIWWNKTYKKWTGVESYSAEELYDLFIQSI